MVPPEEAIYDVRGQTLPAWLEIYCGTYVLVCIYLFIPIPSQSAGLKSRQGPVPERMPR